MKTSIILVTLIVLNTSALLSETLSTFINGIHPLVFVVLEIVLLISLYVNYVLKGLHEIANVDLSQIQLFVVKSKNKTSKNS